MIKSKFLWFILQINHAVQNLFLIFFSSFSKCQEIFWNEISTSRIHSLCSLMILSWYFFKDIENLHFCKTISWWLHFIIVDTMKTMRRLFKFFVRTWVKVWWLLFIISMICRVSISDQIAVNFCFFYSSSHWSIVYVSCSLISRESSSSASSISDFIMQRSFSDMMSHEIKMSSFQLCYNRVAVIMLKYQIITSKKSLK